MIDQFLCKTAPYLKRTKKLDFLKVQFTTKVYSIWKEKQKYIYWSCLRNRCCRQSTKLERSPNNKVTVETKRESVTFVQNLDIIKPTAGGTQENKNKKNEICNKRRDQDKTVRPLQEKKQKESEKKSTPTPKSLTTNKSTTRWNITTNRKLNESQNERWD